MMLSKETSCEALQFHSFIRHMECRLQKSFPRLHGHIERVLVS